MDCFAFFGGSNSQIDLDFFDDLDEIILHHIVVNFQKTQESISPSYLLQSPYCDILQATAKGDGKFLNICKRSRIGETVGNDIIEELQTLGILSIEESRETPLKKHPKQKIKKHLRSYRIQSKIRFRQPFIRFWFGFVAPYKKELQEGKSDRFWSNYYQHRDRCASLVFEQLSNELVESLYQEKGDALVQKGSFWDQYSEFDLLAKTKKGKVLLGECKYKGRKVCKNELTKLKEKAIESSINVDLYILFSLSGFSNELIQNREKNLLLLEAKDFKKLL